MAHAFCQILIIGVMPVGRYSVGIKVSDYIKGNPNPMSTVPVKFLIDVIPVYQTACLSRYVLFLKTIKLSYIYLYYFKIDLQLLVQLPMEHVQLCHKHLLINLKVLVLRRALVQELLEQVYFLLLEKPYIIP